MLLLLLVLFCSFWACGTLRFQHCQASRIDGSGFQGFGFESMGSRVQELRLGCKVQQGLVYFVSTPQCSLIKYPSLGFSDQV